MYMKRVNIRNASALIVEAAGSCETAAKSY